MRRNGSRWASPPSRYKIPGDILIRAATPDDLEELIDLLDAVSAEDLWLATQSPIDREQRRALWLDHLKHEDRLMLVAVHGRRAIGEIAVYQHPDYGPLLGMMVHEAYRGRGVGKHLLKGAIDWTKARGYPELHLLVFAHNERALGLYANFGFVETERYPQDITREDGRTWDTILMVRSCA